MIKQNIKKMFELQYSQLDDQSQIGKMDESFTPVGINFEHSNDKKKAYCKSF